MNGIVPPMPMYIASLPKNALRGRLDRRFEPRRGGRRIPAAHARIRPRTHLRAVRRIALQRLLDRARRRACGSTPGGRRNDSLSAVYGRSTLPAFCSDGMPSTPVTDSVGRQVLLSSSSTGSSDSGLHAARRTAACVQRRRRAPSRRRAPAAADPPESCACSASRACRRSSASSTRSSSCRAMRKLDGSDAAGHARVHAFASAPRRAACR